MQKGTEITENVVATETVEKRNAKRSASVTIRSLGNNIASLKELDFITKEEFKELKELQGRVVTRFVEKTMK